MLTFRMRSIVVPTFRLGVPRDYEQARCAFQQTQCAHGACDAFAEAIQDNSTFWVLDNNSVPQPERADTATTEVAPVVRAMLED